MKGSSEIDRGFRVFFFVLGMLVGQLLIWIETFFLLLGRFTGLSRCCGGFFSKIIEEEHWLVRRYFAVRNNGFRTHSFYSAVRHSRATTFRKTMGITLG
jgi:hypothetical protein